MPITAPILGGVTLPRPSGYVERAGHRGGSMLLVNGAVSFDLVTTVMKRTFVLTWRGLTTDQKGTINTAYNAIKNGGASAAFTPPTDETPAATTVTWSDQNFELEWEATSAGGGRILLWETTMMLREV